ncbi:hypothetical protein ZWY2020_027505 [Hordeum vulgare]|nr:hypothetical protein ZWY2020_027505 [Hordeum vulgare]
MSHVEAGSTRLDGHAALRPQPQQSGTWEPWTLYGKKRPSNSTPAVGSDRNRAKKKHIAKPVRRRAKQRRGGGDRIQEPARRRSRKKPEALSNPSMRSSINRPPTPDQEEEEEEEEVGKEASLGDIINLKLVESGEKERLMELLRERLVECGWRDDMKALCRAYARKKGRNNVTLDDLIHVITPKGRASVPDAVKAELLQRIRSFLMSSSLW